MHKPRKNIDCGRYTNDHSTLQNGSRGKLLRKSLSEKFVAEIAPFGRRKLAARINILAIFQVRNDAIVAFDGRRRADIGGKCGVAVLELLRAGDEQHALEIDSSEVPAFTLLLEHKNTGIFAHHSPDVPAIRQCGRSGLGRTIVGFEFLERLRRGFDKNEVNARPNLVTLGIVRLVIDIIRQFIDHQLVDRDVAQARKEIKEFVKIPNERLIIKVAYVNVHVLSKKDVRTSRRRLKTNTQSTKKGGNGAQPVD